MQMALENLDIKRVTQIVSQLVEQVSCIECCKYYMVPETASCGHTLCHLCWKKRRTCPFCALQINRESIKLNLPLHDLTEHCHILCDSLETLFNIKLDDFMLITPGELGSQNCPLKNVNEWLERSQNHFSAPVVNSESLSQEVHHIDNQELSVQIHMPPVKQKTPTKIVHRSIPQDDWDKIEPIPEKYEFIKDKENIIGPMDIEPLIIDDKEYSVINPRRSSRNKDLKNITNHTTEENVGNTSISKGSSCVSDKMSCNVKQNWNSVKRMRKEFSKLNRKKRNKLNISIEMCKKNQNSGNKLDVEIPISNNEQIFEIDDNTPNDRLNILHSVVDEQDNKINSNVNSDVIEDKLTDTNKPITLSNTYTNDTTNQAIDNNKLKEKVNVDVAEGEQIPLTKSMTSDKNKPGFRMEDNRVQFFKKGIICPNPMECTPKFHTHNLHIDADSVPNSGNIDISIKIGNTLTNIIIKQNKPDVQIKVNTEREVQTSLGPHHIIPPNNTSQSNDMNVLGKQFNVEDINDKRIQMLNNNKNNIQSHSNKSFPVKKNTASTDTATAHFEITESVEKELSTHMECQNNNKCSLNTVKNNTQTVQCKVAPLSVLNSVDQELLNNDLDIFDSETMKENNVRSQKSSDYAPSEILIPTIQTKHVTQSNVEKRDREINSGDDDVDEEIPKKKIKVVPEKGKITNTTGECNENSYVEDPVNYDALMNQVFANIDADIDDIQHTQCNKDKNVNSSSKNINNNNVADNKANSQNTLGQKQCETNFKDNDSETVFSMMEKYNDRGTNNNKVSASEIEAIEEILTPVAYQNIQDAANCSLQDVEVLDDGSDKYVVEDTPQKMQTLLKAKQKNGSTKGTKVNLENITNSNETLESKKSNQNNTVIELVTKKAITETPLTINKFVHHIMHKSTPVARKSLSFENKNASNYHHEAEETICPTAESIVKNTQEKEFMYKAFENSPEIIYKPLTKTNDMSNNRKLCIAGSCLNSDELRKLKYLCTERKWVYVDKYINDITHLVVAVDDQKKCQRSVKYMRALAAGKWIVTFEWVKKCLIAKQYVDEAQFEALDNTGEPGPKRSRVAKTKLFDGIKFFCMAPFSVLDINSLKGLLEDAGGVVVNEAKKVQVTDNTEGPCLLLAEPENTQEDQFIYLAMELKIVPVNFEWALNCLGNYTLEPVQELLLCPSALLPKAVSKWPTSLLS